MTCWNFDRWKILLSVEPVQKGTRACKCHNVNRLKLDRALSWSYSPWLYCISPPICPETDWFIWAILTGNFQVISDQANPYLIRTRIQTKALLKHPLILSHSFIPGLLSCNQQTLSPSPSPSASLSSSPSQPPTSQLLLVVVCWCSDTSQICEWKRGSDSNNKQWMLL